jgi:hypothetical protein
LRAVIVAETRRVLAEQDDEHDLHVGEIVEKMLEAFERAVENSSDPDLKPPYEDTGEHNDWRDVRPSNARAKQAWKSIFTFAAQDVVDGLTPVIEKVVQRLRDGEYGTA